MWFTWSLSVVYGSDGQSREAGTLTPNFRRKFRVNSSQSLGENTLCNFLLRQVGWSWYACTDHDAEHPAVESQLLSDVKVFHSVEQIVVWSREGDPVSSDERP